VGGALLLLSVALLSGCFRVALKEQPVTSIDVRFDKNAMCPGETGQLSIWAKLKTGEVLGSENLSEGKVRWDSYRVTLNGQRVEEGRVVVPADPMAVKIPSRLDIAVDGHPELNTAFTVPIHFKCRFTAEFRGQDGRDGASGQDGENGRRGQDGRSYTVPGKSGFQKDPGGNGSDGRDGRDGQDGEPGRDAEDLEVRVTMAAPSPDLRLLQVKVTGQQSRREAVYLVDPNGGSLVVSATGGSGGDGGRGGHGGRGGDAGDGEPDGNSGNGGNGGNGANGADGGRGGRITVLVSPAAQAHLPVLQFLNAGGRGGNPGAPGGGGSNGSFGRTNGRNGRMGQSGRRGGRQGPDGPTPEIRVEGS